MKLKIAGLAMATFALILLAVPVTNAQTSEVTTNESTVTQTNSSVYAGMLATLQSLMKQVEALRAQLAKVTGQVERLLGDDIQEGVANESVKKVQELLATDPTIYPEGLTTGYFGPLTKKAIERFQEKNGLEVTGEMNEQTRTLMEAFMENDDDHDREHISRGLLMRSDIAKKARQKVCEKSHILCVDVMIDEDMMDDSSDDMMDDDEDMMDDDEDMMDDDEDMMDDSSDDDSEKDESDEDSDNGMNDDHSMMN